MISTKRTNSADPGFAELIELLDRELLGEYGEQQAFYSQFNKVDAIKQVIVAYADDVPVGCGAIKRFNDEAAEVKRMYVKDEFRGMQIAKSILKQLEDWALETGFSATVLETGTKQLRAIDLYQKNGYVIIPNYGQYIGVESSVCFRKNIG